MSTRCIAGSAGDVNSIWWRRQITASGDVINLGCRIGDIRCAGAVIFQTTSAGRIACDIYNPPIVIHCVLLWCRRQIAAGGKVEYLCFGITDKYIRGACAIWGRAARRRATRWCSTRWCSTRGCTWTTTACVRASVGQIESCTVGGELNVAVFVGTVYRRACRRESAQCFGRGVTVWVATNTNYAVFCFYLVEEWRSTGIFASVMSNLKHVAVEVLAWAYKLSFYLLSCITHK